MAVFNTLEKNKSFLKLLSRKVLGLTLSRHIGEVLNFENFTSSLIFSEK